LLLNETITSLKQFFDNVQLEAVEDVECGWQEHHEAFLRHVDNKVMDFIEEKMGRKVDLKRMQDGRLEITQEMAK